MNNKKKVSICIPVFNCEKYIEYAVESILLQTYTNFELIIIDNHSTDRTYEILKRFNDERIKIVHNDENIGLINNWNKCYELAACEFIKILCADDVLLPNAIEKMMNTFEENSELGIVFTNYKHTNSSNTFKSNQILNTKVNHKIESGVKTIKRALVKNDEFSCCPSLFMISRMALLKIGKFEELENGNNFASDFEFAIRILSKFDGYVISDVLCNIRIHDEQSGASDKKRKDSFLFYMKEFNNYIADKYGINYNFIDKIIIDNNLIKCGVYDLLQKLSSKDFRKLNHDLIYMIKSTNIISLLIEFVLFIIYRIPQKAISIIIKK